MYLAYSAKLLSFYPSDIDITIPELPGWIARKSAGRGIYTVTHNLNVSDPNNILITGIALDPNITVSVANIASNAFAITAKKNGEECIANFMFVLVVKK